MSGYPSYMAGYLCHGFHQGLPYIWPFACEQYSVAGGSLVEINRMAKLRLQVYKATGISTLPDLVHMARQEGDWNLRAAILFRLADRLSSRNPLKLALKTEALCFLE
jgi:hypothetical protein